MLHFEFKRESGQSFLFFTFGGCIFVAISLTGETIGTDVLLKGRFPLTDFACFAHGASSDFFWLVIDKHGCLLLMVYMNKGEQ